MLTTKFSATDIVRYKKDTRLYVVWSVDAKSAGTKNNMMTFAIYQIMPKSIYDKLDHDSIGDSRVISNVKDEDLDIF